MRQEALVAGVRTVTIEAKSRAKLESPGPHRGFRFLGTTFEYSIGQTRFKNRAEPLKIY